MLLPAVAAEGGSASRDVIANDKGPLLVSLGASVRRPPLCVAMTSEAPFCFVVVALITYTHVPYDPQ